MAKTYKEYAEIVKSSVSEIRNTLTELTGEDCSTLKLININDKLTNLSLGNKLLININADNYEGATFTATHEDQETVATAIVSEQSAIITVPKGGTYTISNDQDEQTKEAKLIDSVDLQFNKFKATIKVTLANELVGETIACTLESDKLEQKAESTTVTFDIKKKGNWTVGVKDNTYITKSVNVENSQEYTTSLTVDPSSVPTITVRSKEEDNGKTIKCTKDETVLEKVLKNKECVFILPETGTWKITCDDYPEITKTVNVSSAKAFKCALRSTIYGIKIKESDDDPTNRITYTDNAINMSPLTVTLSDGSVNYGEWKDTWIFKKIYPVMLKTNGTIDYKLNPDDQTKKEEGGNSDISSTSYDGNAMLCIEKFYTKFGMDGSDEVIQISDEEEDGFEPIGFVRSDGSVADKIYMPMFGGFKDGNGKLRSLSGQTITYSISWTDSVTAAEKNGNGYGICSYAMDEAFSTVVTILIKSCDWQKKLGEGRQYANAKTGILTNKGAFGYDPRTKTVKVLWVEDFVSAYNYNEGIYWWESGILAVNNKLYVKMKPPYSGTETSGYSEVTGFVSGVNVISKMNCSNMYGRYPIEYYGSKTTYETAYWSISSLDSKVKAASRACHCGIWGRNVDQDSSWTLNYCGASLSYLPPA